MDAMSNLSNDKLNEIASRARTLGISENDISQELNFINSVKEKKCKKENKIAPNN